RALVTMAGRCMSTGSAGSPDYRMPHAARPARRRPCGGLAAPERRDARLLPDPHLRLADEGHAARHLEPAAAVDQLHLGLVHLALVGLEDGAAGVLAAAFGLHAADDLHARDRLVAAIVLALVAGRIRPARVEQFDDPAGEGAVGGLGDLHDRLGLAGLVVDG